MLYRSVCDVVRDFLHDEAFAEHDRILAKYLKPDLLIIDDMGMKQLPKRSGEYLFEIVMRRYETRSTIMTSNRDRSYVGATRPTTPQPGENTRGVFSPGRKKGARLEDVWQSSPVLFFSSTNADGKTALI